MRIKCTFCKIEMNRKPCTIPKSGNVFCNRKCYGKYVKLNESGNTLNNLKLGHGWNKGLSKKKGDILLYGRPRTEETKRKISEALLGKPKVDRIKLECPACYNKFEILPSSAKKGQKFCSVKCSNLFVSKTERIQ